MDNIIEMDEGGLIEAVEIVPVDARNPAVIAAEINVIKAQTAAIIQTLGGQVVSGVYEIGRLLCEAKEAVPRGEWGAWLETNVAYSDSTAQNFMKIYRELSDGQVDMLTGKTQAELFAGLDYSRMVEIFKLPKAERARLAEEFDLAGLSAREVKAAVKRLRANGGVDISANSSDAASQGYEESLKKEVEAVKKDYEAKLSERDDEIVDLTAAKGKAEMDALEAKGKVEAAEKAKAAAEDALKKAEAEKEKAVNAAEKEHKAEVKKLNKEIEELRSIQPKAEISEEEIERIKAEAIADIKKRHEVELVQLRIDGEQAVSDVRAEAEAEAERRIEEMKQKLIAASDDTVKVVSVLTEQVSELLTKITERVQGAPDEVKDKLSGAVCRLLTAAAESFKAE